MWGRTGFAGGPALKALQPQPYEYPNHSAFDRPRVTRQQVVVAEELHSFYARPGELNLKVNTTIQNAKHTQMELGLKLSYIKNEVRNRLNTTLPFWWR
jgi:hypothetical protein